MTRRFFIGRRMSSAEISAKTAAFWFPRTPRKTPPETRRLAWPHECALTDGTKATETTIPACKRVAWWSVPDRGDTRIPLCAYHLRMHVRAIERLARLGRKVSFADGRCIVWGCKRKPVAFGACCVHEKRGVAHERALDAIERQETGQ